MLTSRARRIPLIDVDDETQREMIVSVVTQYRILKFVSVNVKETQMLRKTTAGSERGYVRQSCGGADGHAGDGCNPYDG